MKDWCLGLKRQTPSNHQHILSNLVHTEPMEGKSIRTFLLQREAGRHFTRLSRCFQYYRSLSLSVLFLLSFKNFVILEPKRYLPSWHFIIHDGLVHVQLTLGSFPWLMTPHMATSDSHIYPNWLANIINSFFHFLSHGEPPVHAPLPCAVMSWLGLLQLQP